jgi:hypothetical protein
MVFFISSPFDNKDGFSPGNIFQGVIYIVYRQLAGFLPLSGMFLTISGIRCVIRASGISAERYKIIQLTGKIFANGWRRIGNNDFKCPFLAVQ